MESYQTLNRELVLTVRDLRKENFDLRDLVNSLKSENMTITSEFSDFKRRALDKFTKISEIIGSVGADLFDETPKRAVQPEMSKIRYSVGVNSSGAGSLPRSSPEKKMTRKTGSFHVNVGRRRGAQRPREVGTTDEDTDLHDMSIDNIQDWLKTDQIEISVPIKEGLEGHEEAQPPEDTSQIQEEAKQVPEEPPQEVPENLEGLYKNMTTIVEENSKSISHSSLLQVTKFAASTPHNNNKPFTEGSRLDVSPIEFNKCDQRCLQANVDKMERIFEKKSPEVPEESPVTPKMPKNVTIRRRERVIRDSPESTPEESGKTPREPEETPKEPRKTPRTPEPKKKAKKSAARKKLADKTNLTEKSTDEELPKPIKVEELDEIVECRRPKRRAAPQNLAEPSLGIKMRRK